MFDRILVALMLSTLVLTPAKAVDDVLGDEVNVPVAPRIYRADLWEGAKNVGSGTKKVTYGVGSTVWFAGKTAETVGKTGLAVLELAVAGPSVIYSGYETAAKHITKFEDHMASAYKAGKNAVKNVPTTAGYFKEGVVELGTGIATIAKTTYAAVKDAIESEKAQNAKAAVVSAVSTVASKVSAGFSWLASKVLGGFSEAVSVNFDNVTF